MNAERRRGWRRGAAWTATALACLLVLFALVAPNDLGRLTPAALLRIPLEGLLGVALVLAAPARVRRPVAAFVGVALGLLAILKVIDAGFYATLARPFNLGYDWSLLAAAVEVLTRSIGRAGAIGSVVVAVVLAVAVLVLMPLSVLRLTRLADRRRTATARVAAVLGVAWVACAVLGVQIVPGVPVAAGAHDRVRQIQADLRDRSVFAAEAAVDAFRDTPGERLLTGLRGKDVIVAFVESYGRSAVEDPQFAPQVGAVLDAGNHRLRAAGFTSRSAYLTSPTVTGASWLAHATLLSGVWVNNQQRFRDLTAGNRLTLNRAFQRANWRTVAVMPAITRDWPESGFFGYDHIYTAQNLGYRGPGFSLDTIPDQYTLSAFQRTERAARAAPRRAPVMAEIALVSSHSPWTPTPRLINWNDVGDGSVYTGTDVGDPPDVVLRDHTKLRNEYRRSIEYSLNSLISYVETYGDDDLVLVFLGDHQPTPVVTGEGAGRDVPVTIVARDSSIVDRISGWGWHEGLRPGPQAPVWPMNAFRDRFLTAFGSQPGPSGQR